MSTIQWFCNEVEKALRIDSCDSAYRVNPRVNPTMVYSETELTPDGEDAALVWNGKTITVTYPSKSSTPRTANERLMSRGRMNHFAVNLNKDDVCTVAKTIGDWEFHSREGM